MEEMDVFKINDDDDYIIYNYSSSSSSGSSIEISCDMNLQCIDRICFQAWWSSTTLHTTLAVGAHPSGL